MANGFGSSAAFTVTSDGTATGTVVGTYTFADSFDALKVLYFGLTNDGVYSCASPVRKSLIKNWHNLFTSDCAAGDTTCAAGLTHAWRRSDLSGTTDAFVSVLNPPGRGIGTLSNVPVGASQKTNPFCNSADANASPATTSFGGSSDFTDLDPVRTPCVSGKDGVCEAYQNFSSVGAKFAGDLGVVLPILIPDSTSTLASDLYPSQACSTACTTVAPIKSNQIPAGFKCPGGSAPIAGLCFMPFAGSASSPDPRCVTPNTTKCVDITPKADGRVYNLAVVVAQSQIPTAQRGTAPFQIAIDANKRIQSTGAFYRIHSNTAGANNVPDPTGAGTTGICKENDDTSQIGCLTDSDPCSVGFAGREAAKGYPGTASGSTSQPLKALAVNGTPPFTPARIRIWRSRTCWPRPAPPRCNRCRAACTSRQSTGSATCWVARGARAVHGHQQHQRGRHQQQGLRRHSGRRAVPRLPGDGQHHDTRPEHPGPGQHRAGRLRQRQQHRRLLGLADHDPVASVERA